MEVNKKNKELYKVLFNSTKSSQEELALTDLIKECIINKDYIVYNGGGPYNEKGELYIKEYDVVVIFTWTNDPIFMVVTDDDGDFCVLKGCDNTGNLIVKNF